MSVLHPTEHFEGCLAEWDTDTIVSRVTLLLAEAVCILLTWLHVGTPSATSPKTSSLSSVLLSDGKSIGLGPYLT